MLSTQFVALYKPCKPKPNLNIKIRFCKEFYISPYPKIVIVKNHVQ